MNAYEFAVVNEYGAILENTIAWTAQACEYNAVGIFGPDWRDKGLCICQIIPTPVIGKAKGCWHDDTRAVKPQQEIEWFAKAGGK